MINKLLGLLTILCTTGYQAGAAVCRCPDGWVYFRSSCYLFTNSAHVTWFNAQKQCHQRNASLVSIGDQLENSFIYNFLNQHFKCGENDHWIGATDASVERHWTWESDGSPASFTDWAHGQPNDNDQNEDCATIQRELTGRHTWHDRACYQKNLDYICEKSCQFNKMQFGISRMVQCTDACPDGWLAFHDSCYLFMDEMNLTWPSSAHICSAYRANLVEIEDPAENSFLKSRLTADYECLHDNHSFWLGATDVAVEGYWEWHGDDSHLNFTDWAPGHPATGGGPDTHDCAIMSRQHDDHSVSWRDANCTEKHYPLCERRLVHDGTYQSVFG